jgi:hypothetical protein
MSASSSRLARYLELLRSCGECGRQGLSDDELAYGHDCEDPS